MLCLVSTTQVLAAAAELAVPHFATKCIFSAATQGATQEAFRSTLTLLAVRVPQALVQTPSNRQCTHPHPALQHLAADLVCSENDEMSWLQGIIVFYGVMSALRGYCFSILNNRMTMNLRYAIAAYTPVLRHAGVLHAGVMHTSRTSGS